MNPRPLGPEPSAIPNFATPRSSNVQMLLYWYFAEMSSKNMPFSEVGMSASTLLTVRFFGRIRKGKVTLHGKNAWAEGALPHYVRTEQKRAQVGNIEF